MHTDFVTRCVRNKVVDAERYSSMKFASLAAAILSTLTTEVVYADGVGVGLRGLSDVSPILTFIFSVAGLIFLFVFFAWIKLSLSYIEKSCVKFQKLWTYLAQTILLVTISGFGAYLIGIYEAYEPNYYYLLISIVIASVSIYAISVQSGVKEHKQNDA